MPCSTCSLTSLRISPARTTTEVVPSPTSASWDRAMSTRIRAAGWTMSRSCCSQRTGSSVHAMRGRGRGRGRRANLHDRRAIVGNRLPAVLVHHQQVAAVGTQSGLHRALNRQTGIDIRDDLALALGGVGSWTGRAGRGQPGARPKGASLRGERWGSSPSLRTMMVGVCPPKDMLAVVWWSDPSSPKRSADAEGRGW